MLARIADNTAAVWDWAPGRHLDVRSARAARGIGLEFPRPEPPNLPEKTSTGPSLAHEQGFTRRERGFMRERASVQRLANGVGLGPDPRGWILEERARER